MNNKLIFEIRQIASKYRINIPKDYSEKEIIEEFIEKIDWQSLSEYGWSDYKCLSTDFVRFFQEKLDWDYISAFHFPSVPLRDFFIEFKYKLNWNNVCIIKKLSEDIIREFQNDVNWERISQYQNMSEEFIKEFSHKINFNKLLNNKFCPEKYKSIKVFL
jgi:hypothetical protein